MKKVSVVVPVYNAQKHLKECIRSILRQADIIIELILVDDGSLDASGRICDRYAKKDARVHVIHQHNQGSVAARRNGVLSATGEYICFCDADDVLPQNSLKLMLHHMTAFSGETVVVGQMCRILGSITYHSKRSSPCFQITEATVYDHAEFIDKLYCSWFGISNLPVSLWGKLYPATLLKQTMVRMTDDIHFFGEDLLMTLDLMPRADRIIVIPDVVYCYRPGGGTTKFQRHIIDDCLNLYHIKKKYKDLYPMPQDIDALMDIELCNMAIAWFRMYNASGSFAQEDMLSFIEQIRNLPDVRSALANPRIDSGRFLNVKMLRQYSSEEILSAIQPTPVTKIKQIVRQIIYRLA